MSDTQKNLYKKLYGRRGEDLAVKELKKLGYKLINRNVTTPYGEADVIVQKDGRIVFVEVKSRSGVSFGEPKDAVDYRKQEKYRRIAEYYLDGADGKDVSFAVAETTPDGVNIIFDAF